MRLHDIPLHWKSRIAEDPTSARSKEYLEIQQRILAENVQHQFETTDLQSEVGTTLVGFFERVGGVPCSDCKRTLLSLNRLSVDQIRERHNAFVIEIEKNAKKASMSLWAQLCVYADSLSTGGVVTRFLISKWLEEACVLEEKKNEKPIKPESTEINNSINGEVKRENILHSNGDSEAVSPSNKNGES